MKWPWVSRERYEDMQAQMRGRVTDALVVERAALGMYRELLEKYHALAVPSRPAPAPASEVVVPQPDQPPDVVLNAIQQISPNRDKTYEANWQYWERNKVRAAAHPEAFADEIISGAVWEPEDISILILPDSPLPVT